MNEHSLTQAWAWDVEVGENQTGRQKVATPTIHIFLCEVKARGAQKSFPGYQERPLRR